MASEPLLAVRFAVFRFFTPPRFVEDFLAVLALRTSGFDRLDFRFVPWRDDCVSPDSVSPPITEPAVVLCSVEKLNSTFCLRDFNPEGAFLVPRRLVCPTSEVVRFVAAFP